MKRKKLRNRETDKKKGGEQMQLRKYEDVKIKKFEKRLK